MAHSGVRKCGISSVTDKISSSTHQPPCSSSGRIKRQENPLRRILVPLDGSWRAEYVLPMVTLLARFHYSQIQIVHVVKTPEMARHLPPAQEDIDLSDRVVARNREEALRLSRAGSNGFTPGRHRMSKSTWSSVTMQPLAIHEIGDQEKIDLVALNAHGYSGNNQWPYGSMVNNFILYGKVPLLIVQDRPQKRNKSGAYNNQGKFDSYTCAGGAGRFTRHASPRAEIQLKTLGTHRPENTPTQASPKWRRQILPR